MLVGHSEKHLISIYDIHIAIIQKTKLTERNHKKTSLDTQRSDTTEHAGKWVPYNPRTQANIDGSLITLLISQNNRISSHQNNHP